MSEQHTQGRLTLESVENDNRQIVHKCPVDSDGLSILTVVEHNDAIFAAVYNDEDARRLVACWNACEGISTDNLEDNLPVKELATRYNAVLAQRDELLYAFKRLLASDPEGAIANASEAELLSATKDEEADPVIREQAAAVLQARYAVSNVKGEAESQESTYYLQDTRSYVGNCPVWWAMNGKGYTTDLRRAHRYTLKEAMAQHRSRDTDLPWACSEIDLLRRPTIDVQDMHKLRSFDDQKTLLKGVTA